MALLVVVAGVGAASGLWAAAEVARADAPPTVASPALRVCLAIALGLCAAAVVLRFADAPLAIPAGLVLVWLLVTTGVIDARTRRIPNRLTYPGAPLLLVSLLPPTVADGDPRGLLRAVACGLSVFAAFFVLAVVSGGGFGMGDVKLGGIVGLGLGHLGVGVVVAAAVVAFLVAGVVALALLALGRRGRRDLLPFGPYLSLGGLTTLLLSGA